MADKKRLMLVDGHALAYRAYHAIPPLTTPKGEPSNATFGFANILLKAIADTKPDYVIATFDTGRTFRHEEYSEYKATRAETPDDLRAQFQRITEMVGRLSIPIVTKDGYEADDVLGTLSRKAEKNDLETVIVTGDTDTFQLISDSVKVLYPQRNVRETKIYDRDAVRERYGLEPEQLIDYKALVGDTSDNIPGVRGVGDKTATRLLQKYGTVEEIYAHLDQVQQARFRNALQKGREDAAMSKRLVTIVRDLDVPEIDRDASTWGQYNRDEVVAFFREMGFTSLVSRLPGGPGGVPVQQQQLLLFGSEEPALQQPHLAEDTCLYCVVDTQESLRTLVERLRQVEAFAFDTETTSTDAMRAKLVGIGICDEPEHAFYIPVGHDERLRPGKQLPLDDVVDALAPVFADESIGKICHNAKFDMKIMARHRMPVSGLRIDTMVAAWLVQPSGRGIGLKSQALQRLGIEMTPITDLIGTGRKQITIDKVSVARVARYCCADADVTLRLVPRLREQLEETTQWSLFTDLEMPLIPVLMDMEMHGMPVNTDYLGDISTRMTQRLDELAQQIHAAAGHPFNIKSTKQLGSVLFDELGLPVIRRTRTGYSTAADVLEALKNEHPIAELILEYRQLEKLQGTYVDALPALVNPHTGRIHTTLGQTGTSTGRLSSSDPNLQNIPVRSEEGRRIRGAFVAPAGHRLLGCDYSQVELRLLAHLSQDPELVGAFMRDEDVHASTAAAIHGVPLDEVTPKQRALAKTINFGLMYGMGNYGLASRTNLSADEAQIFIDAYFGRFSRVKTYLDETIAKAEKEGYVETLLGHRRYFPELSEGTRVNAGVRRAAERAAINMPIQGTAADIIKIAMLRVHRLLRERDMRSRMVLQIHDELVLDVPEDELPAVTDLVVSTMENAYQLDVPLKVSVAVGRNWMEMK